MASHRMLGIDLRSRDGNNVPAAVLEDHPDELFKWFFANTDADLAQIRLLSLKIGRCTDISSILDDLDSVFPTEVVQHAIWKPEVYHSLTKSVAGGSAGLTDEPICFVLQTPLDDGPFCSFALCRRQNVIKGIYLYNDDAFDPAVMKGGASSRSKWRSTGMQIITLPEMFLQAHSVHLSQLLPRLISKIAAVETALVAGNQGYPDFNAISRTLHTCHANLVDLERRSRFEESIIGAIEAIITANQHGSLPWPSLASAKTAIASRQFDFESLPRRIENCRATMNSLMQRRNEELNLELTHASHQIAEAALRDSKSMKTIAIMTMVLLPGTAVASLFSMNLFDWSAKDGSQIASKWLWIYFVVSVPLTGGILALWWYWMRKKDTSMRLRGVRHKAGTFNDEENALDHNVSDEDVQQYSTVPK